MTDIPNATLKRLSLYRRCFIELHDQDIKKIQSSELSQVIGIDSATIRRDFSYLGELGRQGYGYEVEIVLEALNKLLKTNTKQACVLIGIGDLGRAILKYFSTDKFKNSTFDTPVNLVAGFDIDPEKIGQNIGELPVYDLKILADYIKKHNVRYVILAVPPKSAQNVADSLAGLGIKGIMNLSSTIINVCTDIIVHEVDLNLELETLFFKVLQSQM